ncbi:uncharacterized protein LOC143285771 [Babylonia areolata]|uniref:uncharacterized protein LOC143285771 n=1 Tax=Babylonia areolata TaxID=304850 RepID=UPI003FCEF341
MDEFQNSFSEVFFAMSKVLLFSADFVFRLFRLRILKRVNSEHFVHANLVLIYIYLLQQNELTCMDNTVLASCVFIYACNTLSLVLNYYFGYIWRLLYIIYSKIQAYGKLRVFIYGTSLAFAAALISYLTVLGLTFAGASFSAHMMWRFEDNIIYIDQAITVPQEIFVHPSTKGEKPPFYLSKMHRYLMEDVQMLCKFTLEAPYDFHPTDYDVVWRRNGVPFTMTDRHKHHLSFKEAKNYTFSEWHRKQRGIFKYHLKAVLKIHLLRESDFGIYTCHCRKQSSISYHFLANYLDKYFFKDENETTQRKTKPIHTLSSKRQRELEETVFEDEFYNICEFLIIKIQRRQEIIRAPATAILYFSTSYWHNSWSEDVELLDYYVNARSLEEMCKDSYFHGCSKFLLLYWNFWHMQGVLYGAPPTALMTIWNSGEDPVNCYSLVLCLCEKAYGYHTVKYLRRYYNTTTQQFDLIEVLHPHELMVVPREQNMLNLFRNRSECSPVIERPVCEKPSSVCKDKWNFRTILDFAEVAVTYFHWVEIVVMIVLFIVLVCSIRTTVLFLEFAGRHIRRLTLDGSMAYLTTAERTGLFSQSQNTVAKLPELEENHYDVFLSFSDTQADMERVQDKIASLLERCGINVCLQNRDLSPNLPEIQVLTQAIENSDRFLIFLSSAYLEDHFRKDFEAAMIMETLSSRSEGTSSVLLIKLDQCQVPPWLSHLELHDWTTFSLTHEDHCLRLLKWLERPERKSTFRSILDVCLTILPIVFVGVLFLPCYQLAHKL